MDGGFWFGVEKKEEEEHGRDRTLSEEAAREEEAAEEEGMALRRSRSLEEREPGGGGGRWARGAWDSLDDGAVSLRLWSMGVWETYICVVGGVFGGGGAK
ncbi:hypothetical protein PLESTB_000617500 [Pleodorina starrii]|uniref:Uncharacterized protein n=1 Tax=Pleodorina starrii TaxID=330485 RepID=A0A9W6F0N6_9CHLO|nr:hypothetical protein PLESTB_000617500 [Pleodorina starrii]